MPFNAEEFGKLILKENDLTGVKIEETQAVDHYDLNDRTVRVKEGRLEKKSLTSLTIVCHEIGHAIQHNEEYEPLVQRTNLVEKTQWISRLGGVILYSALPLILATGSFGFIKLSLLLVICSVLVGVLIHLITLNVEIDASFNRAMPILKEKIPEEYHAQCNNVLKAAAFTYVIGALTSFLSLRYIWLLLSRVR
jgi:Zn-dependent membrane protease YugP